MNATRKKNMLDLFLEGAKSGWTIGTHNMLPGVVMAFILIRLLNETGLLKIFGSIAGPVMAIWGLPGEGIMALLGAFMSVGGAVGVVVALVSEGQLTSTHVAILAPALVLMGAVVQYIGRCLSTSGTNPKYWGIQIGICIINAMVAMWIMRLILVFV